LTLDIMANPRPRPHRRAPRVLPEGFIRLEDAGAQVGLKKTASHRAYKRGEIPGMDFGGLIVVRSDWLVRRMEQADAEAEEKRRRYREQQERRGTAEDPEPRRGRGDPSNEDGMGSAGGGE
jgi:hypothetical protein